MIVTCTLNPSLDYYMEGSADVKASGLNRSDLEYFEAGGKGINVSIVLNNLGIPSKAFGFIGGFTKDFYIDLLAKYEYIQPSFTYIEGHTRINVKYRGTNTGMDINAEGPMITHEAMDNLALKASRLDEKDVFILAGSAKDYLGQRIITMLDHAIENGVKVCLDSEPWLMKQMLDKDVFLMKTTPYELSEIVEKQMEDIDDLVDGAICLYKRGVKNVLVVSQNKDAILVCDQGAFKATLQSEVKAINTVGTGDALVAGFVMHYNRSRDILDSFKFGASCGIANVYSKGIATREKIDRYYATCEIAPLRKAV